ncbi:MAG: serine/threonine protein kinase [Acidobacteria bacterium]|nr:serine/threonine protein kinase [Acidobacteriota bacterium]
MTPERSWIGRHIRAYEIVSLLGAGGMGEVYRAKDTKLARDVAIKVLPASLAHDLGRRSRLEQEARSLAALNHPHIAAIYGFEETDNEYALVLELVEGPTLADRLGTSAMPLKEALRIARQLAEALEAAHKKGLIHRDFKPANIKITPDGYVKVLDFGLAKAFGNDSASDLSQAPTGTRQGVVLGTPAYMSPEQATGQSLDERTDIWAFGCVLYEMLCGRRSFPGDSISDTVAAVLGREPKWDALPGNLPDNIRRLLRRCLEKDPKQRLHHVADARIELDEVLADPTADAPDSRAGTTRTVWKVAGGIAALLFLAAFGAYFLLNTQSKNTPARALVEPVARVAERQITTNPTENPIVFAAISPDGKYVAYSDIRALYLRFIDTGETRMLTVPPGLCFR